MMLAQNHAVVDHGMSILGGVYVPEVAIPAVMEVTHQKKLYTWNGWVGDHEETQETVFEFADRSNRTRIWVDVHGNVVTKS